MIVRTGDGARWTVVATVESSGGGEVEVVYWCRPECAGPEVEMTRIPAGQCEETA